MAAGHFLQKTGSCALSSACPTLSVDGEGFLDYLEMVENARRGHVKGFAPLLAHLYKYADGLEAYRNKWDGQLEGAAWEKVRNWPEPLPSPEDLSKYLQRRGGGAFSVRLFRDGKPLDGCIVQVDEIMTEPPKKAMSTDDLGPLLRGKKESELQDKMYDMVLQRIEGGDSKGAVEAFTAYNHRGRDESRSHPRGIPKARKDGRSERRSSQHHRDREGQDPRKLPSYRGLHPSRRFDADVLERDPRNLFPENSARTTLDEARVHTTSTKSLIPPSFSRF